jgi:hypothetical protein
MSPEALDQSRSLDDRSGSWAGRQRADRWPARIWHVPRNRGL